MNINHDLLSEFFATTSYVGRSSSIDQPRDSAADRADFSSWDEDEHPRHPPGSEDGGEFAPKSGGGGGVDHVFEHAGQKVRVMNEEEKRHLDDYFEQSDINDSLRRGHKLDGYDNDKVRVLDAVIGRSKLDAGGFLYRGVAGPGGRQIAEQLRQGKGVVDLGYQSWSRSKGVSQDFIDFAEDGGGGALLRVLSSKGMKALDVGGDQKEVIFPRGSSIRFVSYNEKLNMIEVEVVAK